MSNKRAKRRASLFQENKRLREQIAALEADRCDLRRTERALAQYWGLLDAILTGTDDLYGLKGTDSNYQATNQAFCRFAGISEREIRGYGDFDLFSHELADILHRHDVRILQRAVPQSYEAELPLKKSPIWVRIEKTPVFDNQGSCVGILCIVRDRSLLHRYQIQQDILTRAGHDGFWCTNVHGTILDVNHAYCTITGYSRREMLGKNLHEVEMLCTPKELSLQTQAIVRDGFGVHRTMHRSKDNRILEFDASVVYSPKQGGHFYRFFRNAVLAEQPVPIAPPLEKAPLAHEPQSRAHRKVLNLNEIVTLAIDREIDHIPPGISLRKDLDSNLKNTLANQQQVLQIIINLVTNAVEAMEGRGHLRIVTRNVELSRDCLGENPKIEPGAYAYLAISDTGRGISPGFVNKIFEPFITTKFKGRGMGLASVTRNIDEHNGLVSVKSEEGKGTTFTVYLPTTDAGVDRGGSIPQIPSGTETVLIVDSEARVLEAGKEILERLAYHVILAPNLDEAMRQVKSHYPPVDVVVLDTETSGEAHEDFVRHLLQINPQLKIVLAGDHELDGWAQDFLDAGAHGFVRKPFRAEVLAPKIRQTLDT